MSERGVRARRFGWVAATSAVITAMVIAVASMVLLAVLGVENFSAAQQEEAAVADVTAFVEKGSVDRTISVEVRTVPASTLTIPAGQFGTGVITRSPNTTGSVVEEGDALIYVDEAPVIVIAGAVPAYRNLGKGLQGNDVEQLQQFLERNGFDVYDADGVFEASTAAALAAFYAAQGIAPVSEDGSPATGGMDVGLPLSRYVFVASAPVTVNGVCGDVGAPSEGLSCVLSSTKATLVVVDDSSESLTGLAVEFTVGQGEQVTAKVGKLVTGGTTSEQGEGEGGTSEEDEDEDETVYKVDNLPEATDGDIADRATVVVESTPKDTLRVPATAVREASDGSTFVREAVDGDEASTADADRPIEVILCAGGYCAVRGEDLVEGTEVVLLG